MRGFRRFGVGVLGTAVLALSMLLLVDAFWPRVQVMLTGDYLIPAAGLKPLVALVSIAAVLLLRKRLPSGFMMFSGLAFGVVLVLSFANLVALQGVSVQDALVSQNAYYWTFLLMPLVLGVRSTVSSRRFTRVLLWVGLPLVLFGLLQFVLQRPIVSIEVPQAGFRVNSWRFHGTGHIRAFSLFGSGQTFGYLLAPVLALLIVKAFRSRGARRFWFVAWAMATAAATAATLTRNTFLVVGLAAAATLLYLTPLRRVVWLLPVMSVTIAAVGMAAAAWLSPAGDNGGILDATSLWVRLGEWRDLLDQYANAPLTAQLFGLGLVQNEQASSSLRVLIDNSYLAVLLNSGLLGLLGWLTLMCALWGYLHTAAVRTMDEGKIAIAAAFSTWALAGVFNVPIAIFGVYGIWAFLLIPRRTPSAVPQTARVRASRRRQEAVGQAMGAASATTSGT